MPSAYAVGGAVTKKPGVQSRILLHVGALLPSENVVEPSHAYMPRVIQQCKYGCIQIS